MVSWAKALGVNERFSVAGAAGVLGLVFVLGLFGFLSLLGANPSKPFNSLRSEEEVVARQGSGERPRGAPSQGDPGPAAPEQSPAAGETPAEATPPNPTSAAAVLAAIAPGETRATPAPGLPQPAPVKSPTAVPTPQVPPDVIPSPTPEPTAPPITPTPQPEVCSTGGTPAIRESGHHVRLEYASVISIGGDVLLLDVGGTVTVLHLTALTTVTGNLSAATLVRAEGRRESDGSVTAELVEVLCPDWARG